MPTTYSDLFAKLGAIAKRIDEIRTAQRTFAPLDFTTASGLNTIRAAYTLKQVSMLTPVADQDQAGDFGRPAIAALIAAAERTLIDTVNDTTDIRAATVEDAFREVAAQFMSDPDTINDSTVGVTIAARAGNTGTGTVLGTTLAPTYLARGAALTSAQPSQVIRNEVWRITCAADANSGLSAGNEGFVIQTARGYDNADRRWRGGTGGALVALNATSALVEASAIPGQNMLANSAFERTASNIATNWTARVGTAGVDINTTATAFDGSSAMRLVGGGTANPAFRQQFGAQSGTPRTLKPDKTYLVALRTRSNSGTVNKTITAQFDNGSGTAIGLSGAQTVTASSHTTSYSTTSGFIHTPANLTPGTYYFDIQNTGTTLAGGEEIYIDGVVVAEVVRVAPLSGGVVVLAGATQFRNGDHFNATWANNEAGLFAYWLDCMFRCYERGLVLPIATGGAETISDSLIA